eukprot:6274874-Pyramimonas_sp.AAC.1
MLAGMGSVSGHNLVSAVSNAGCLACWGLSSPTPFVHEDITPRCRIPGRDVWVGRPRRFALTSLPLVNSMLDICSTYKDWAHVGLNMGFSPQRRAQSL